MAHKKHSNKGAPRHMAIDEHAQGRRTFGHGRKPPHPHQSGALPPMAASGPMPGQSEFDGDEEAAQRQGMRSARGAPPTDGGDAPAPQMAGGDGDGDGDYSGL
jgi:hypothetical protein